MKKTIILALFIFLFLSLYSYADEFRIPFPCFPKQLQEEFKKYHRKLDLNGNDRTKESWGFIENKGTRFSIYTYKPATHSDFEVIMKIVQDVTGGINE